VAGVFPLDSASVLQIGRAIGRWMGAAHPGACSAVIGSDTRRSSAWMLHTLAGAMMSEGVAVLNVGVTSTPGVAHLARAGGFQLGVMISASHNPADQNGIKLFGADGFKLDDAAEESIETLINGPLSSSSGRPFGLVRDMQPDATKRPDYLDYLTHLTADLPAQALEGLRVVLDCAHGAAYQLAPAAFRARQAEVIASGVQPDGDNINVHSGSEYVRRDRAALLDLVARHRADLGIAFDGDADRVVFVTPEGMLVDGDHTLGILAVTLHAQGRLPGQSVVATDMSNRGLEDYLNAHNITLVRTKVGDRYVMERMRSGGGALGGEQAGHIILLDADHTCGDGIYAALRVAALVAGHKRQGGPTLHQLAANIPRYPQVIASAHLSGRVDLRTVDGLAALEREALASFGGKGRVNMRFSGTEPNLLRVMIEGGPQTTLTNVVDCALALCEPVIRATHTAQPVVDIVDCVTGAPVRR
jgi:phosphoglucosamine mutase